MLKLEVSTATINSHLATLGQRFDEEMTKWKASFTGYPSFTASLHKLLLKNRKTVLVGSVAELRALIEAIDLATGSTLTPYMHARQQKSFTKQSHMEKLLQALDKVFDYDKFIYKSQGWNAYKLVGSHGLRICPYCHLNHVNYHGQATSKATPKKLEMRPPLDHFLPKSIYPYLAVSLHNLVPSCYQCNSSIKGDEVPGANLPHPFDPAVALDMSFGIKGSALAIHGVTNGEISLAVTGNGAWDEFSRFFYLEERYQWYTPEVSDMLKRQRDLDESDKIIQSLVRRPAFILGFNPDDCESRALGICLHSIARQQGII
ncbi:hypothetical protein [Pseudomonas piscis]|uniref:HNH endonuclease n=1 Tax=Pseudomonas piscis TaxID=2614538 RepID=A0A7X1PL38_9PSED|nr:hypothetical protein [Pseudomonas piscis]MQA54199.1 hypothetical protein [Pseudomonas piscis]